MEQNVAINPTSNFTFSNTFPIENSPSILKKIQSSAKLYQLCKF